MSETQQPTRSNSLIRRWRMIAFVVIAVAVTVLATRLIVESTPRNLSFTLRNDVQVSEFVILPDDNSYPAALAISQDGIFYTGSYESGAVWQIAPDGTTREVLETRQVIGSVTGLTVAPDGVLYVLDRIVPLDAQGGTIWRIIDEATLPEALVTLTNDPQTGVFLPDDIEVDGAGSIYITDRGPNRIWRFDSDGSNGVIWWSAPESVQDTDFDTTGLAYDSLNDALLISDGAANIIYSVPVKADDPIDEAQVLYDHGDQRDAPGFDGLTVAPTGEIYLTGLATNRVYQLDDGELIELAQGFRGASDVVYDANRERLYVTNWDQFSLGFNTTPLLPFALDMIELSPQSTE